MRYTYRYFWLFTVFSIAFFLSSFFCFLYHFSISNSFHAVLDPDSYGLLGINLYKGYGLSFNKDFGPTVYRGPLYPFFIALFLLLSNGSYPYSVWLGQALIHSFTSLFSFLITETIWNKRIAILAGISVASYPLLIWYVPRLWNETILTFLFTLLIYLSITNNKEIIKSIGISIIIASLSLTKATFLPLIFFTPLFLFKDYRNKRVTLIIPFLATLIIFPWTLRNYYLTNHIIPVHTGAGFNLIMGNKYAKTFFEKPFLSYNLIWDDKSNEIKAIAGEIKDKGATREIKEDFLFLELGINEITNSPFLIFKKIFVAGVFFWISGETLIKTLIIIILKIPVMIMAIFGGFFAIKLKYRKIYFAIWLIIIYWFLHLPFIPPARLSTPIMPIMIILAASSFNWHNIREISN